MQTKQNQEAIAQYEALLKLKPNGALDLNNLANLYQSEKDSRAMATAELALRLAPDNPAVQDTLGWILVEQGQLPRALDLLAKEGGQVAQGCGNPLSLWRHIDAQRK